MQVAKNRYGARWYERNGVECCRHGVSLDESCDRCAYLLEMNARRVVDRELPHIVGAGHVVCFDEGMR